MNYSLQNFVKAAAFPVILFLASVVAVEAQFADLSAWQDVLKQTPFLLLIATLVLSLRFNQTRVVYITVFLTLLWASSTSIEHFEHLNFSPSLFYISTLFVLCLFSFDQNKAIWSRHGVIRIVILLAVVMVNYRFNQSITLHQYLQWQLFELTSSNISKTFQVELFSAAIALILLAVRQLMAPSQLNTNLWVLAFGLTVLQFGRFGFETQLLCFCLYGVLLIHGVLTDSYQMAFSDELTGLSARRALMQSSISLGKKYTVAMMDVDHFKKFNDTYGHDVGDQVLRLVASKISDVRGGGKSYRYGGEEFTIVFPNKSVNYAIPYLEQVRETIANYQMAIRNEDRPDDSEEGKSFRKKSPAATKFVNVTISIGVAEREGELKEFDQILKKADEALYRAKQAGRNCLAE